MCRRANSLGLQCRHFDASHALQVYLRTSRHRYILRPIVRQSPHCLKPKPETHPPKSSQAGITESIAMTKKKAPTWRHRAVEAARIFDPVAVLFTSSLLVSFVTCQFVSEASISRCRPPLYTSCACLGLGFAPGSSGARRAQKGVSKAVVLQAQRSWVVRPFLRSYVLKSSQFQDRFGLGTEPQAFEPVPLQRHGGTWMWGLGDVSHTLWLGQRKERHTHTHTHHPQEEKLPAPSTSHRHAALATKFPE